MDGDGAVAPSHEQNALVLVMIGSYTTWVIWGSFAVKWYLMRWEKGSKFHGSDKAIPSPGSHDLQEQDKRVSASSQVYFDYHDMVPEQYRWLEKDLAAVNRHWDWLCTRHGIWGNQF